MSKRKSATQRKQEQNAREFEIAVRRREVVKFRALGFNYRNIGERLDISHEQARLDEMAARAEVKAETQETVEEMRMRENDRLDMARAAIATQVLKGDLRAVDRWIKLSERTAKMNGLDAPQIAEWGGSLEGAAPTLQVIINATPTSPKAGTGISDQSD